MVYNLFEHKQQVERAKLHPEVLKEIDKIPMKKTEEGVKSAFNCIAYPSDLIPVFPTIWRDEFEYLYWLTLIETSLINATIQQTIQVGPHHRHGVSYVLKKIDEAQPAFAFYLEHDSNSVPYIDEDIIIVEF